MTEPFEDPRKSEMREKCEVAIDAAGHDLVKSPVAVPLPNGLNGAIKGDLQSIDGETVRHAYYLRPAGDKPVPKWLVNLAAAARGSDDVKVLVVVADVSTTLEKSCRASGVGLLKLTDENTFDFVVNPDEFDPEAVSAALQERVGDVRRRMETKLELNKGQLERNFGKVKDITAGMPPDTRDKYIESVETSRVKWDEWGRRISELLDEAGSIGNESLVETAEGLLEEGVDAD